MIQYTHILIASFLESLIKPENLGDYYWGATAPDVCYLASLRRDQTHLSSKVILDDIIRYPHLKSFLQGYLVHCLTDEVKLKDLLGLMGLEKDSRLEKYIAVAEGFQKNQLLKKFFFSHFRRNQTNEKIVRIVRSLLPEKMGV